MIRHPGASLAVPITNNGQVVLLRQYRFAVQARLLEFPAGTLEAGEDPLESMQRELGEEAWLQRCPLGCPWSDAALSRLFRRGDSLFLGPGAHGSGEPTGW
jgi:8-oxo-dGTP pyrophosphatase MutT (NUDIX family)